MSDLPGGAVATRPLHFIWILDCSGSMHGQKIQRLNFAISEALPAMKSVAHENPSAQVFVRVLTFSSGARWHVGQPTPLEQFSWRDLTAGGVTDMGKALSMVAEQLRMPPMTDRALPPVLVLVSDGHPTDNFNQGLKALMSEQWGKRAVRIAIGIGADVDDAVLARFVDHPELPVLRADNAPTLTKFIMWASVDVLKSASSPLSRPRGAGSPVSNVPIPNAPQPVTADPADVW